jgi:hypothetical protein
LVLGVLVHFSEPWRAEGGGSKSNLVLTECHFFGVMCLVCVGSFKDVIVPKIYIKVQITIVLTQWS